MTTNTYENINDFLKQYPFISDIVKKEGIHFINKTDKKLGFLSRQDLKDKIYSDNTESRENININKNKI